MASPLVDFVTLSDNVQVAAGSAGTISTNRITMSPGRTKLSVQAFVLDAAGTAGVAGCSIAHQLFVQGPNPSGSSPITRQGWFTFQTTGLPTDGSLYLAAIDLCSLGFGLDTNYGATYRALMITTAAEGYFTIVATAGN